MTLRSRLIAAFLASTLLPLAATVWITTSLLDRSLRYATTGELDRLSRTLEVTAKQFYQRERDALKQDALAGPLLRHLEGAPIPQPADRLHDARQRRLDRERHEDAAVQLLAEGRRLYDAASSPRTFVEVRGGHVNSSDVDPDVFYGAIGTFLRGRGLIEITDHLPLAAVH